MKVEHLCFSMKVTDSLLGTWIGRMNIVTKLSLNFGALIYRPNSGLWSPLIYFLDIFQITDPLNNLLGRVKFLLWTVYDPTQIT